MTGKRLTPREILVMCHKLSCEIYERESREATDNEQQG